MARLLLSRRSLFVGPQHSALPPPHSHAAAHAVDTTASSQPAQAAEDLRFKTRAPALPHERAATCTIAQRADCNVQARTPRVARVGSNSILRAPWTASQALSVRLLGTGLWQPACCLALSGAPRFPFCTNLNRNVGTGSSRFRESRRESLESLDVESRMPSTPLTPLNYSSLSHKWPGSYMMLFTKLLHKFSWRTPASGQSEHRS